MRILNLTSAVLLSDTSFGIMKKSTRSRRPSYFAYGFVNYFDVVKIIFEKSKTTFQSRISIMTYSINLKL